jgi:hypothetical protein
VEIGSKITPMGMANISLPKTSDRIKEDGLTVSNTAKVHKSTKTVQSTPDNSKTATSTARAALPTPTTLTTKAISCKTRSLAMVSAKANSTGTKATGRMGKCTVTA